MNFNDNLIRLLVEVQNELNYLAELEEDSTKHEILTSIADAMNTFVERSNND